TPTTRSLRPSPRPFCTASRLASTSTRRPPTATTVRCSPPTTGRCRSTPAMGAPARPRCCARRSPTRWPTIPPSSRATSWCSVPTSTRWRLDAAHRAPYDLATVPAGTWEVGLERLLLGVTMTEDDQRLVGGALPLDDVDSGDIDVAGRFAELVGRLGVAVRDLCDPRP